MPFYVFIFCFSQLVVTFLFLEHVEAIGNYPVMLLNRGN